MIFGRYDAENQALQYVNRPNRILLTLGESRGKKFPRFWKQVSRRSYLDSPSILLSNGLRAILRWEYI